MYTKTSYFGVLSAVVLVVFAGCPPSNTVVGAWRIVYDGPCTGVISAETALFIYSNGTVELFDTNHAVPGTWTRSGSIFAMTVNPPANPSVSYQAVVSGDSLINGTYIGSGFNGCWSATRPF